MSEISVKELEELFKLIIAKLQYDLVKKIDLKTVFYRTIAADDWDLHNPKKLKDIVIIGDLQDDIENVKKLLDDHDRPCTYVDFDRVASILHAISQELNPPD